MKNGYQIRVLNTINFSKSMKYNPFEYIHSEEDILKLVTALIANTKGDGKSGDEFWQKAETLLYTALIGYVHYVAPAEEQKPANPEVSAAQDIRLEPDEKGNYRNRFAGFEFRHVLKLEFDSDNRSCYGNSRSHGFTVRPVAAT